jgi:hypothetical protein
MVFSEIFEQELGKDEPAKTHEKADLPRHVAMGPLKAEAAAVRAAIEVNKKPLPEKRLFERR